MIACRAGSVLMWEGRPAFVEGEARPGVKKGSRVGLATSVCLPWPVRLKASVLWCGFVLGNGGRSGCNGASGDAGGCARAVGSFIPRGDF